MDQRIQFKTKVILISLIGLMTGTSVISCKKDKKDNLGLLLAAYLLSQRAPGVYITGQLVDSSNNPLANRTITIKGRGENASLALNSVTTSGSGTTYQPAGFYKEVAANGTRTSGADATTITANSYSSTNVTAEPSTRYTASETSTRDSQCGSSVTSLFGTTTNRRVVCDTTALADGAVSAGISTDVVDSSTTVVTITTDSSGNFTSQKFDVSRTGNTFSISVDGIDKSRRLRINRAGTGSILSSSGNVYLSTNTTVDEGTFQIFNLSVEVVYPRNIRTISGTLTGNTSVAAGETVLLQGTVTVPSGVTLTIGEGALVYGSTSPGGALLVKQGGKLIANGTATKPIVFTSEKAVGSRAPGDWQGIILQGNGIQSLGGVGSSAVGEGDTGTFGGNSNSDSSGSLTYVRIEFAGAPFSPGNERNCLSLMGVGSGTTIDYVQCHRGYDDGFEWWGGAVNHKYIVSTANRDDQLDFTDAWIGTVQYAIGHIETTAIAANDDTSRCVEGDGRGNNSCNSSARSGGECADPWFANLTCVASTGSNLAASGTNLGPAWFVRRSESSQVAVGAISHSLVYGFTAAVACNRGTSGQGASTRYGDILYNTTAAATSGCGGANDVTWGGPTATGAPALANYNVTAPDWTPASSVAASGALTTVASTFSSSPRVDNTSFRGAVDVNAVKWWDGWTSFPAN